MISWRPTQAAHMFSAILPREDRSSVSPRLDMSGDTGSFPPITTRPCHRTSGFVQGTTYPTQIPRTCRASAHSTPSRRTRPATEISRPKEPQPLELFYRAERQISRSYNESWMAYGGCEHMR